jgi:hypothetical protein
MRIAVISDIGNCLALDVLDDLRGDGVEQRCLPGRRDRAGRSRVRHVARLRELKLRW